MTAPFAPPPTRPIVLVGAAIACVIAIPFARRNDWLGWAAFLVIAAAAVALWGMLLRACWRSTVEWWRGKSDP